jgi:hypothetical protein
MQVEVFQADFIRSQSSSMGPVTGRQMDMTVFNSGLRWVYFGTHLGLKKQLATTVIFLPLLLCNFVYT